MIPVSCICILLCMALTKDEGKHKGPPPPVATFYGYMKFKQIPTHIGAPFTIIQDCDPTQDSLIIADTYDFKKVKLGKITECEMIYEMKDGLVNSITILLKDEKSRDQARRQAQKQFGQSRFSQNELLSVFGWTTSTPQGEVTVSLAYTAHEPTSQMYIKRKYEAPD